MEHLSLVLGLTAATIHVAAYFLYNVQTHVGQSKPNAASWSIWVFLSILNALTYHGAGQSVALTLQYFAGSVACFLTFVYVLRIGRFEWPARKDWLYAGLGAIAGILWLRFHQAGYANLVITGAILISFGPTFRGVLRDPTKEIPRSWILWTAACLVTTLNVALQHKSLIAYVSPIALALAHGYVAVLCRSKRKTAFASRLAENTRTTR